VIHNTSLPTKSSPSQHYVYIITITFPFLLFLRKQSKISTNIIMQKMTESLQSIDQITYQIYHETEGSWTPTIVIAIFLLFKYVFSNSLRLQRFYGTQKLYWRKRLGYRDETKYQMGVGDGANLNLKRQG